MNHTLRIPAYFKLEAVLEFAQSVAELPDDTTGLVLDFNGWKDARGAPITPFGMLIVSQSIRNLYKRIPMLTMIPINLPDNDIESYATRMNFFEACGIDLKKPFGNAKGSPTYLPLTQKMTDDVIHSWQAEDLGKELAQRLVQKQDGALVSTLTYSFTEIIRNVIEHSRSKDFWYCAQYWQSKGEAEIAIMDCGMGIRKSLSDNPYLRPKLTDDQLALKYALMPGMSGKMYGDKKPVDKWDNTGYGLYMTYRICNEGGNFFIASGDSGLYREKEEDNYYHKHYLPGVAIRMRMRVSTLENFSTHYHQNFISDGERIAKENQGIVPTGEYMSTMLRSDFNRASKKDES